jgi:hypothetical protein
MSMKNFSAAKIFMLRGSQHGRYPAQSDEGKSLEV